MILLKIDILDGSEMTVVVSNERDAARLRRFTSEADKAFCDSERWVKVSKLMTHEHAGPHVGWTLGMVLPGDNPDEAADKVRE